MPTYEFRCPTGHDFEKFYRSISSAATEVLCPTCGKVALRQLSAGGGLLFKGSGFYITDYGKDGKKSQTAVAPSGEGTKESGDTAAAKSEAAGTAEKSSSAGSDSASVSKPKSDSKAESRQNSAGAGSSSRTSSKKPKASE